MVREAIAQGTTALVAGLMALASAGGCLGAMDAGDPDMQGREVGLPYRLIVASAEGRAGEWMYLPVNVEPADDRVVIEADMRELPANHSATFDSTNRVLAWRPGQSDGGTHVIRFAAFGPNGWNAVATARIRVNGVPMIELISSGAGARVTSAASPTDASVQVSEETLSLVDVRVVGADGERVELVLSSFPIPPYWTELHAAPASGATLSIQPPRYSAGTYVLKLTAQGATHVPERTVTITVVDDHAPVVHALTVSPEIVAPGQVIWGEFQADDVGAALPDVTVGGHRAHIDREAAYTGRFRFAYQVPESETAPVLPIHVRVVDRAGNSSAAASSVKLDCLPPVFTDIRVRRLGANTELEIQFDVSEDLRATPQVVVVGVGTATLFSQRGTRYVFRLASDALSQRRADIVVSGRDLAGNLGFAQSEE